MSEGYNFIKMTEGYNFIEVQGGDNDGHPQFLATRENLEHIARVASEDGWTDRVDGWEDLIWTEEKKEELRKAILKVRELEGLD